MSETLNDWDDAWRKPDPRITTLKEHADLIAGDIKKLRLDLDIFQTGNDALLIKKQPREDIVLLRSLEMITVDEAKNLLKMLESVDEENHTVAKETINNLINKI